MSLALVALGYRRRDGTKLAGFVSQVRWGKGEFDVNRVKITFDREKAFPFPKHIALAVAKQSLCSRRLRGFSLRGEVMATSLLTCRCGAKNRLTLGGPRVSKFRCGSCKHEFDPLELAKAVVERVPTPTDEYQLEPEDDIEFECPDESCGWTGYALDADADPNQKLTCPECGKKVRKAAV